MTLHRLPTGLLLTLFALLVLCCRQDGVRAKPGDPHWQEVQRHHLAVPEPSSLIWDAARGCFWTVSDRTGRIYALSRGGELLDSLEWEGEDLEAIAIDPLDSTFYVVEERPGTFDHLDATGHLLNSFQLDGLDVSGNQGIEGLAFNTAGSRLFAVKERDPGLLLEIDRTGALLSSIQLYSAKDYSDLFCPGSGDTLRILSDESTALLTLLADGTLLRKEKLDTITNPEGVALVEDTLFVVSDKNSNLVLYVLQP